jgi:hypothetical protein
MNYLTVRGQKSNRAHKDEIGVSRAVVLLEALCRICFVASSF